MSIPGLSYKPSEDEAYEKHAQEELDRSVEIDDMVRTKGGRHSLDGYEERERGDAWGDLYDQFNALPPPMEQVWKIQASANRMREKLEKIRALACLTSDRKAILDIVDANEPTAVRPKR